MPQLYEIISELSQNCLYLKALKQAKRYYSINLNDLKVLSPFNVFQQLKKLNDKMETSSSIGSDSALSCANFGE